MNKFFKKISVNNGEQRFNLRPLVVAIATSLSSLLLMSSATQATDLQIYAKPAGGQTTIFLMLDNSGSMKSNNDGLSKNRLERLKAGVNDLLTKDLVTLRDGTVVDIRNAYVGLGVFTDGSTNHNGLIKVAAAKLDSASTLSTSGSQRAKLKAAVNLMDGTSWTPSANAYAEAAAYMLGSTTYWEKVTPRNIAVETHRLTRSYAVSGSRNNYTYTYTYNLSTCRTLSATSWTNSTQTCSSWNTATKTTGTMSSTINTATPNWNNQPVVSYSSRIASNPTNPDTNPSKDSTQTIYYSSNETQNYITTVDSKKTGTPAAKSVSDSANILVSNTAANIDLQYNSPLPKKAVTCDGQGIYFLSDGLPNFSTDDVTQGLMSAALTETYSTGTNEFTCPTLGLPNNLPNTTGDGGSSNGMSGWNCMGELAKRLFNQEKNSKNVSINTAFVGFGSAFKELTGDAKYACKLGSKIKGDECSTDATKTDLKNPEGGFGNGGYYYVQTDAEVTESIAKFIKDNTNTVIEPLSTGTISVPVDTLNPNGFQPYGYLRALEPNPDGRSATWTGNLKRYNILTKGTNSGALGDKDNKLVFDDKGEFSQTSYDLWNKTDLPDGGLVRQGGAYWKLPVPTNAVAKQEAIYKDNVLLTRAIPAIEASPNGLRRVFTDVQSVSGSTLVAQAKGELLAVPLKSSSVASNGTFVLKQFKEQSILKDFPVLLKRKLLNFLGYEMSINTTETTLPTTLNTPTKPYVSLGGSIHSYPVQLTYSGDLDEGGDLTNIRKQSVLFGSMEGGLHIVDTDDGVEQMVFLPREILNDAEKSKALKPQAESAISHGVSGAWVADPAYKFVTSTDKDVSSTVTASKMNVYGGMRMGGSSYYGLDVLNPEAPKLLFRVGADQTDYSRMGQSWSKPVLANIRYNKKITRVMIVGGGYDDCYENPRFKLGNASNSNTDYTDTSCNSKQTAQGNAVYIIDATTGARLWWASNSGSDTNNSDMKHSIVSRISTIDRDGDGLVDHLYFGDLGGQLFRVDLNNLTNKDAATLGVRAVRLADLSTSTHRAAGDQPRFYQPPTLTIHDEGLDTFIVAAIASGDRSTPLDVSPTDGRDAMLPLKKLSERPVNNVFGIIDRDFIAKDLITNSALVLKTKDIGLSLLQVNPQKVTVTGKVSSIFFPYSATGKQGWYRSLSSDNATGNQIASRTSGGIKAFEEEPIALKNNLFIPVYDPEGTGVKQLSDCSPRIIGESNSQLYCLPYGVCLDASGNKDTIMESKTGFQYITDNNNKLINSNIIGSGIRGVTLGPGPDSGKPNSCGSLTMLGNIKGSGKWECTRILNPIRWYEKYVSAS